MAYKTPFTAHPLLAAFQLPLTLMSLDDWASVTLTGPDRLEYLQGQVTTDVRELKPDRQIICAHCNAKGKMWSNMRLFHQGEGFAFIERSSLLNGQVNELKKYAVFSDVFINQDIDAVLLGIAGHQARETLAEIFDVLPNEQHSVVQQQDSTLLHFALPKERFLLVTNATQAELLFGKISSKAQLNNSQQWLALDIEAGYPIIDEINSAQLIPQAVNLQALEGISFTKGCYSGQEMVARAKYRGANKRAMYWLAGTADRIPETGEELEWQIGENWRRTGTVLAAIQLKDKIVWVQAVLNNDLASDAVLRVREDSQSKLTIQPLPYSLVGEK